MTAYLLQERKYGYSYKPNYQKRGRTLSVNVANRWWEETVLQGHIVESTMSKS